MLEQASATLVPRGTHHRASTLAPLTSRETGILHTKGFDTESGVQQVSLSLFFLSLSLSLSLYASNFLFYYDLGCRRFGFVSKK